MANPSLLQAVPEEGCDTMSQEDLLQYFQGLLQQAQIRGINIPECDLSHLEKVRKDLTRTLESSGSTDEDGCAQCIAGSSQMSLHIAKVPFIHSPNGQTDDHSEDDDQPTDDPGGQDAYDEERVRTGERDEEAGYDDFSKKEERRKWMEFNNRCWKQWRWEMDTPPCNNKHDQDGRPCDNAHQASASTVHVPQRPSRPPPPRRVLVELEASAQRQKPSTTHGGGKSEIVIGADKAYLAPGNGSDSQ